MIRGITWTHIISLESFRSFRGPLFCKTVNGQDFFLLFLTVNRFQRIQNSSADRQGDRMSMTMMIWISKFELLIPKWTHCQEETGVRNKHANSRPHKKFSASQTIAEKHCQQRTYKKILKIDYIALYTGRVDY